MTSHYLSGIVKGSFEAVFEPVAKAFGNVYSKEFGRTNKSRVGIILGEKLFLRVNSDVAVTILLEELTDETRIEVISYAGGKGMLAISYAAHQSYVHEVRDFLTDSGFKIDQENEIPYFSDVRTKIKRRARRY